jgi:voltage-gated potassium channel
MTRKRTYRILEKAVDDDVASKWFDLFIILLISLNIAAVIMETVEGLSARYHIYFYYFEFFSVCVFSVEYLLRIWACVEDPRYRAPFTGRLRFMFSPLSIADLLAVLPFYLPMLVTVDLRMLRILRFLRFIRILKFGRYSESIQILGRVMRSRKEEMGIVLLVVAIMLLIASSLLYFVENEAQPQAFSSIPASMWWGIATLTTVGYGDIYPVTPLGKLFGAVLALFGIGLFALPAGILASGFAEELQSRKEDDRSCPHCGKTIE